MTVTPAIEGSEIKHGNGTISLGSVTIERKRDQGICGEIVKREWAPNTRVRARGNKQPSKYHQRAQTERKRGRVAHLVVESRRWLQSRKVETL